MRLCLKKWMGVGTHKKKYFNAAIASTINSISARALVRFFFGWVFLNSMLVVAREPLSFKLRIALFVFVVVFLVGFRFIKRNAQITNPNRYFET